MFKFLEKRRLREAMLVRYLINQYMLSIPEEEFDRLQALPEERQKAAYARMENEALEIGRRMGRKRLEEIVDDYYRQLEAKGELKRELPAYEEYFKYIDFVGKP